MEKHKWLTLKPRLLSTCDDSVVPTGLGAEIHDNPGTEVPGYSLCVPNGTQLSLPYLWNGVLSDPRFNLNCKDLEDLEETSLIP